MVGRWISFWDGLFVEAVLVSGGAMENHHLGFFGSTLALLQFSHGEADEKKRYCGKSSGQQMLGWFTYQGINAIYVYVYMYVHKINTYIYIYVIWICPPLSNNHHQDYYIFSKGSPWTFVCHCHWVGGRSNISQLLHKYQSSTVELLLLSRCATSPKQCVFVWVIKRFQW